MTKSTAIHHPAYTEPNQGIQRVGYELRSSGIGKDAQNPLRSGIHSRGYLPHIKREGRSYFVTFRLADSLPQEVLLRFEQERAARIQEDQGRTAVAKVEIERDFQRSIHRYLDSGTGACHLQTAEIADLVAGALKYFDGQRYILHEWVVMPNHVHVLIWPIPNHLLSNILKSWKQFTSRRAKASLGLRAERFWQKESYDHWVRNDKEESQIRRYIRHNPVKAGLCRQPEDWRWSSAWRPEVAPVSQPAVSPISKSA